MAEEEITAKANVSAGEAPAKKPANKPVVAKPAAAVEKKRFCIVTVGQGGARIGLTLSSVLPNNPFVIAVNTSAEDLNKTGLSDEHRFPIGISGAGKVRNDAKRMLKSFRIKSKDGSQVEFFDAFIGMYEEVIFHPEIQTFVIVSFSSDGGTGSGIGPQITALLTNYCNNTTGFVYGDKKYSYETNPGMPRPVVVGLTAKAALKQEQDNTGNLLNCIECFSDIQKYITDKKDGGYSIGHFFIADNTLPPDVKYESAEEMYKIINARICAPFVKFFGVETNSDIKTLDLQDKVNTLRIPGCSSFMSVTDRNVFNYIVPRGQAVTRSINLVNQDDIDDEKNIKAVLKENDITSIDNISSFFKIEDLGLETDSVSKELMQSSMIGLFGWKGLSAIVEDLRDTVHRIEVANKKKNENLRSNSLGFSSIAEDSEKFNSNFGMGHASNADLMDV
jgi:hypothetical protein